MTARSPCGLNPVPAWLRTNRDRNREGLSRDETIGISVKIAGDANGDGYVNTKDQKEVRNHFGESGTPGCGDADVNCDGSINTKDRKVLRNQFGQTGCSCTE